MEKTQTYTDLLAALNSLVALREVEFEKWLNKESNQYKALQAQTDALNYAIGCLGSTWNTR